MHCHYIIMHYESVVIYGSFASEMYDRQYNYKYNPHDINVSTNIDTSDERVIEVMKEYLLSVGMVKFLDRVQIHRSTTQYIWIPSFHGNPHNKMIPVLTSPLCLWNTEIPSALSTRLLSAAFKNSGLHDFYGREERNDFSLRNLNNLDQIIYLNIADKYPDFKEVFSRGGLLHAAELLGRWRFTPDEVYEIIQECPFSPLILNLIDPEFKIKECYSDSKIEWSPRSQEWLLNKKYYSTRGLIEEIGEDIESLYAL
jgi:hypothetical protein